MFSIALAEQPTGDHDKISEEIAKLLAVKAKTAKQIVTHTPLIVFNDLNQQNANILSEVLYEYLPYLSWEIREDDEETPSVNWNKIPTINGESLEDIFSKRAPAGSATPAASPEITCPHCQEKIQLQILLVGEATPSPAPEPKKIKQPQQPQASVSKPSTKEEIAGLNGEVKENNKPEQEQAQTLPGLESGGTDSTIIKAADSVIMKLSADLEKSFGGLEFDPSASSEHNLDVSKSHPSKNNLEPGLYQLFLPSLKSKVQKTLALDLCQELLGWSEKETIEALKRKVVCVARNIDHADGSLMMDAFENKGLNLNSKKTASL